MDPYYEEYLRYLSSDTDVPLPDVIATAAAEGDVESVRYWLEGPHDSDDEGQRDVNAEDENGSGTARGRRDAAVAGRREARFMLW